jgi:hypothetical protein
MPYVSKAQQAYMHIHHPGIAKRWDKETKDFKGLPARKKARREALKRKARRKHR